MATKKTDTKSDATSRDVDVTVPAVNGVALNDIYKAALTSVRDEIPLRSDLVYEVVGTEKKGDQRVYKVRISWGPRDADPSESDHPKDGDFVKAQIESLNVPTSMPTSLGGDDNA